jgi:hypothetical protein
MLLQTSSHIVRTCRILLGVSLDLPDMSPNRSPVQGNTRVVLPRRLITVADMPIGTARSHKKSIVVDKYQERLSKERGNDGIVGSVGSRKSEENVRRELI